MEKLSPDLFTHVRIIMGLVVGLGIARLLLGSAGFVQHPGKQRVSLLHALWVGSILLELVLFWWWEFALSGITTWNFGIFLFLIAYSVVLFLLAALLYPDNIDEYEGYEDYFLKRRRWFFALLAASFLLDAIDTYIKGLDHWGRLSSDYVIQIPFGLMLCVIACIWARRSLQIGLVLIHIGYQAYLMTRIIEHG